MTKNVKITPMATCPYCGNDSLKPASNAVWLDVAARSVAIARLVMEVRQQGWRAVASAIVDETTRPEPNEHDRACPFCKRGMVTRLTGESIWPDLVTKVLSFARAYLELRGPQGGFGIHEMAYAIVEGEDAEIIDPPPPKPEPEQATVTENQTVNEEDLDDLADSILDGEVVDDTPFDNV